MKSFPHYTQLDAMDCGVTCLRMVAKYYGRSISLDFLRSKTQYGKAGVSLLGLADASETIGLKPLGAKLSFEQLINEAPLPAILHWRQYHYVVLLPNSTKNKLIIADPAKGIIKLTRDEFLKSWISSLLNSSFTICKMLDFPLPQSPKTPMVTGNTVSSLITSINKSACILNPNKSSEVSLSAHILSCIILISLIPPPVSTLLYKDYVLQSLVALHTLRQDVWHF